MKLHCFAVLLAVCALGASAAPLVDVADGLPSPRIRSRAGAQLDDFRGTPTEKRSTSLTYNAANPGATPLLVVPLAAVILDITLVVRVISAALVLPTSQLAIAASILVNQVGTIVPTALCVLLGSCPAPAPVPTAVNTTAPVCLDSTYNEAMINSLFFYGGASTTVKLCPSAVLLLQNPIQFTAANQVLTTLGNPSGILRATIRVTGSSQTNAIYGACDACSGIRIQNIQVDGNRPVLGFVFSPPAIALIEIGGNVANQVVDNIHAFEPRGWSAIHVIEGGSLNCVASVVTNNQIGPWSDGISMACKGSTVTGNVITDATDGAIVIFGAPGTTFTGNTVIADQRQLLGGINLVDYGPFLGDFTGVVVSGNTIKAGGAMIKVGIPLGTLSVGYYNNSAAYNFGGTVTDNTFLSGPTSTGYFGYGITAGGHRNPTITQNSFVGVSFGGVSTPACYITLPPFGALYKDPYTTTLGVYQASFVDATVEFMICSGPGATTSTGVTLTN